MKLSVLSLWTGQRGTDTLGLPESTRGSSLAQRPSLESDFHAPESSSSLGGTASPKTVRPVHARARVVAHLG
jgi:hypothetical protein